MRDCHTIIKHCMINKLLMAMSLFVPLSSCPLVWSYYRLRQFSLIDYRVRHISDIKEFSLGFVQKVFLYFNCDVQRNAIVTCFFRM